MKKILLILSFILLSVVSFAQRQRTTAMFDSDTTTRPKAGFYGIGVRANNIYFVPPTGNNIRLANYSLFTSLTTNYLTKWNGSKLVNSSVFDNGGNVGIGTASPSAKLDISASENSNAIALAGWAINKWSGGEIRFGGVNSSEWSIATLYTSGVEQMRITSSGNVAIGTNSPTSKLQVVGLPTYADNTAATIGGLTVGAFYRTVLGVLMVVY